MTFLRSLDAASWLTIGLIAFVLLSAIGAILWGIRRNRKAKPTPLNIAMTAQYRADRNAEQAQYRADLAAGKFKNN